jgi:hypothetical protein
MAGFEVVYSLVRVLFRFLLQRYCIFQVGHPFQQLAQEWSATLESGRRMFPRLTDLPVPLYSKRASEHPPARPCWLA